MKAQPPTPNDTHC